MRPTALKILDRYSEGKFLRFSYLYHLQLNTEPGSQNCVIERGLLKKRGGVPEGF